MPPISTSCLSSVQVDLNELLLAIPVHVSLCSVGKDLFHFISTRVKKHMLPETWARFYLASAVNAIVALHLRQIIFRDLKPENLLLSESGYAKLADFGLCKKAHRTFSVVGTPEYMAPEIILGRGHDRAVDWWAIGVLLFEFVNGNVPFSARNILETYQKTLAYYGGTYQLVFRNQRLKNVTKRISEFPLFILRCVCLIADCCLVVQSSNSCSQRERSDLEHSGMEPMLFASIGSSRTFAGRSLMSSRSTHHIDLDLSVTAVKVLPERRIVKVHRSEHSGRVQGIIFHSGR